MVAAILATDMQAHFTLTSEFCRHGPTWSKDSIEDRLLLVKTIVHAADLANPTRPFVINCALSACIHAEFACAPSPPQNRVLTAAGAMCCQPLAAARPEPKHALLLESSCAQRSSQHPAPCSAAVEASPFWHAPSQRGWLQQCQCPADVQCASGDGAGPGAAASALHGGQRRGGAVSHGGALNCLACANAGAFAAQACTILHTNVQ